MKILANIISSRIMNSSCSVASLHWRKRLESTLISLVVPGSNVFDAIAQTAAHLDSADIWAGRSSVMDPEEQAKRIGEAWERLPNRPKRQVCFHVVEPDGTLDEFNLGAHAPKLADDDINLIHKLWLDVANESGMEDLRHKEIVTAALARLAEEMKGAGRKEMLDRLRALIGKRSREDREERITVTGDERPTSDCATTTAMITTVMENGYSIVRAQDQAATSKSRMFGLATSSRRIFTSPAKLTPDNEFGEPEAEKQLEIGSETLEVFNEIFHGSLP